MKLKITAKSKDNHTFECIVEVDEIESVDKMFEEQIIKNNLVSYDYKIKYIEPIKDQK